MAPTSTDIKTDDKPIGTMVRFKRLTIQGFKSFPDKAVLEFEHAVCAIVGPNGCGKSNILDALRWVLGEQGPTQLRAQTMSDIIFNGSASRKPVGLAEVSLTVEWLADARPDGYQDVEVTRRLYRSGDSEYLMNRQPCRLKDILDLFLDAGLGKGAYSLIEQGKVDALLLARPDERRGLIEQSAGIVKYKHRKKEAQAKLTLTEQNLDRIRDILGEVKSRRSILARQARKAERFKELQRDRDDTRTMYLTARFAQLKSDRDFTQKRIEDLNDETLKMASIQALTGAAVEQARLRVDSVSAEFREVQKSSEQNEMRLDFLGKRLADQKHRTDDLDRSVREITDDQSALVTRRQAADVKLDQFDQQRSELSRLLADLEQRAEQARLGDTDNQTLLSGLRRDLKALKDQQLHLLDMAAKRRNRQVEIEEGLRRLRSRAERLFREREQSTTERVQCDQSVRASQKMVSEIELGIGKQEQVLKECDARITARRRAVDELRGRIQAMDSRILECRSRERSLDEIIRAGEGLGEGVRSILTDYPSHGSDQHGVLGLMVDLYETEPQYERAIAAALSASLQGVVVEGHSEGLRAVEYLTMRNSGRCSFTPIHPRRYDAAPPTSLDAHRSRPLRELVHAAPDFDTLFDQLLQRVYLVDNLSSAISLWEHESTPVTLVTMNGEIITPEGIITGGADVSAAGEYRAKKQEIRSLQQEIASINTQRSECESERLGYLQLLTETETEKAAIERSLSDARIQLAENRKDWDYLNRQLRQFVLRAEAIETESGVVNDEMAQLAERLDALETEIRSNAMKVQDVDRISELEHAIEQQNSVQERFRKEYAELRINTETTRERLNAVNRDLAGIHDERIRLDETAQRLIAKMQAVQMQQAELEAESRSTGNEIQTCADRRPRIATQFQTTSARLEQERQALQGLEQEWNDAKDSARTIETELAALTVRSTEIASRMDMLREQSAIDLEDAAARLTDLPDLAEIDAWKAHIETQEKEILALGDVNLAALEEHREIVDRNKFLDEQMKDLEDAIQGLRSTIQQINTTSRNRFMEAFTAVNREFASIFAKLFEGGEAELRLENPDDPLETGVEIICKPPGKRARTIELLSGGEKALCALALLLAGFKFRPAPILYLDEVDAALDDANVIRFTRYLKDLSLETQVVMITHNPLSMEIAEALYGITMPEPGISKIVSARIGLI